MKIPTLFWLPFIFMLISGKSLLKLGKTDTQVATDKMPLSQDYQLDLKSSPKIDLIKRKEMTHKNQSDISLKNKLDRNLSWDLNYPVARKAKRTQKTRREIKKIRKLDGPGSSTPFPFIFKPLVIKDSDFADTIIKPYLEPENAAHGVTIIPNLINAQDQNKGPDVKPGKRYLATAISTSGNSSYPNADNRTSI